MHQFPFLRQILVGLHYGQRSTIERIRGLQEILRKVKVQAKGYEHYGLISSSSQRTNPSEED